MLLYIDLNVLVVCRFSLVFLIMDSTRDSQDTSTPKRRRLGTGRILRQTTPKSQLISNCSPIKRQHMKGDSPVRSFSPLIPCNQVEFRCICDSENSVNSDNPGASDILESSQKIEWESLDVCTSKLNEICEKSSEYLEDSEKPEVFEDISNDMFHTKLEQSWLNHVDQKFKKNIEESFDIVNQSISNLDDVMDNKGSLFETQDSFLLDIKDEVIQNIIPNLDKCNAEIKVEKGPVSGFYGLPMITKGLFKSYRNIDKFYGEFNTN